MHAFAYIPAEFQFLIWAVVLIYVGWNALETHLWHWICDEIRYENALIQIYFKFAISQPFESISLIISKI